MSNNRRKVLWDFEILQCESVAILLQYDIMANVNPLKLSETATVTESGGNSGEAQK